MTAARSPRPRRLFVVVSDVPYPDHQGREVSAVNIIVYELLRELARGGYAVSLQLVTSGSVEPPTDEALKLLEAEGIIVLPPLTVEPPPRGRAKAFMSRLGWWGLTEELYPAIRLRGVMADRIQAEQPDVIVTLWSLEGIAATHGIDGYPKIAYHGDVHFVPFQVRMRDRALFAGEDDSRGFLYEALRRARQRMWLAGFRRAHLRLMRDLDVVANVTASNADFYARHRHPRSVYVGNTWKDVPADEVAANGNGVQPSGGRPVKIIGHVGHLGRTGSTYGLRLLLTELCPALTRVMQDVPYEVHLIGGGELVPSLRSLVHQPGVVVSGFVDDLDGELRESDVFLMLNNAGAYQAAFTRHIMAWSLGLCLVVHANSQRAIPEIAHLRNALVGSTPEELAQLIRLAATDSSLNHRLRQGGRETYERHFTPATIAAALSQEIVRMDARGASQN